MKRILVILAVALSSACRTESTLAPISDVTVTVDSAVYHLKGSGGSYNMTLTATIANNSDRNVYLSRGCPTTSLSRPDGDSTRLQFGQYACALVGGLTTPTLTLPPGSTHTETVKLYGSVQPQARPQITMQDLIGPAVFGFYAMTDQKKFQDVHSGPFVLQPPG